MKYVKSKCVLLEDALSGKIYKSMNNKLRLKKIGNYHLYFLSDEKIKEGDWYLNNDILFRADDVFDNGNNPNQNKDNKKIIATTDSYLNEQDRFNGKSWENLLPRPSNEFLKKYCELGGIDEVMVEYEGIEWLDRPLEYFLKVAPDNTITIKPIQPKTYTQESYNKQEVIQILTGYHNAFNTRKGKFGDLLRKQLDDWVKQNL